MGAKRYGFAGQRIRLVYEQGEKEGRARRGAKETNNRRHRSRRGGKGIEQRPTAGRPTGLAPPADVRFAENTSGANAAPGERWNGGAVRLVLPPRTSRIDRRGIRTFDAQRTSSTVPHRLEYFQRVCGAPRCACPVRSAITARRARRAEKKGGVLSNNEEHLRKCAGNDAERGRNRQRHTYEAPPRRYRATPVEMRDSRGVCVQTGQRPPA